MIENMAVVHMTEAEVVKDIALVLAKVRQGVEIVVERDHRTVAFIKPSKPEGRMISEVISDLKARGSNAVSTANGWSNPAAARCSPMPAGLIKKPQELRDLLAYLLGDNPLPP